MADARLVPSNLMAWPRVRDLLPDQKLIVYHLWATCSPACGVQLLDVAAFSAALSLSREALSAAVSDFEGRELVKTDQETGEVFISDWYRFHSFTGPRLRLLFDSVEKIESTKLRQIVDKCIEISKIQRPTAQGKVRKGKVSKPPPALVVVGEQKGGGRGNGIELDELLQATRAEVERGGKEMGGGLVRLVTQRHAKGELTEHDIRLVDDFRRSQKNKAEIQRDAAGRPVTTPPPPPPPLPDAYRRRH